MTQKKFDCVAMKREASLRIYEETKEMNLEERQAYWQEKTNAFLEKQQLRQLQKAQNDT